MQADLIAQGIILKISRVGHKVLSDGMEIFFNLLPTDTEQGAYNMAIDRPDARQTVNTRTAHQVHQQSFHGVIAVMRHTDGISPHVLPKLFEVAISQIAGSHLNANLVQGGIFPRVEMCQMEGNVLTLTKLSYEGLVTVGLFSSQVEVAMNSLQPVSKALEDEQQCHTVGTTANSHQVKLPNIQ